MDDPIDSLELQKLKEENELALKKLKEANIKLKNIQNQCQELKNQVCKLKSELEAMGLRESAINNMISTKIEKETSIKTECEKTIKQLENIVWRRKILAVKLDLEKSNRRPYENIMKMKVIPAEYLGVGRHEKKLQDTLNLKNKLDELQKEAAEKRKLNFECEKSYLEVEKSNNKLMETVRELKKNIENVDILINQQNDELRKLSNEETTINE